MWALRGLRNGVLTTRWPARPDSYAQSARGPATVTVTRPDAAPQPARRRRTSGLRRIVHLRHVDAGSDGTEEWEILALLNPVYDVHRLGIFFTASPRHADILLGTGAGARGMAEPPRRPYDAM